MNPSSTSQILKHAGLDVHAETIAVGIADSTGDLRSHGNIPAHTVALDKLHCRRPLGSLRSSLIFTILQQRTSWYFEIANIRDVTPLAYALSCHASAEMRGCVWRSPGGAQRE